MRVRENLGQLPLPRRLIHLFPLEAQEKRSSTTHILAIPKLDGPITTRREDNALSSPPHDVDTGGMATEGEIELARLGVPYAYSGVFGRRGETRSGDVAEKRRG